MIIGSYISQLENQNSSKSSFIYTLDKSIIDVTYGVVHRRIASLVLKALSRECEPTQMQSLKQRLVDIGGQAVQFKTASSLSVKVRFRVAMHDILIPTSLSHGFSFPRI